ncbi:hypothetical protein BH20ACI2_BH20ACI2_19450 [soil metagenome]
METRKLNLGHPEILFLLISVAAISPIWYVPYFISQDGSSHVNASAIMLQLVSGNTFYSEVYTFNSFFVPNSIGHWMMVLLLTIFSPILVTKIMMSITLIGVAAGVVWLRRSLVGTDIFISILIGFILGFNWLWFLGSYNFTLGLAGFAFGIALYVRWRSKMNFARGVALTVLLGFVFISHLVAFVAFAGSIVFLSFFCEPESRKSAIVRTALSVISTLPLLVIYRIQTVSGETLIPVWRNLSEGWSVSSWAMRFQSADPFSIISRKTLPFTDLENNLLAMVSPGFWVAITFIILAAATLFGPSKKEVLSKRSFPFAVLSLCALLAAMLGPDDFGLYNGSILRERLVLIGLILGVPVFRIETGSLLKPLVAICLAFAVMFQVLATWDYALDNQAATANYISALKKIDDGKNIASVTVLDQKPRFRSEWAAQAVNYAGFGKDLLLWDNYEMAHYLFPVMMKDLITKSFVLDLTTSNVLTSGEPVDEANRKIEVLKRCFHDEVHRIDVLVVYGRDEKLDKIITAAFDSEPYFEQGKVRLFQRRSDH